MPGNNNTDLKNPQGGKEFGQLKRRQSDDLDDINKDYLEDETFEDVEDFENVLIGYKAQFMEFDLDHSGDIDEMELKRMLEKLDQAKTHKEIKKMIREVDMTGSGTITYNEFLQMMLGKKNSILKLILKFENMKSVCDPTSKATPPKRDLASLP